MGFYTAILWMATTAVVGAATAKQDQNPSQAGKSSIYFYDVAASDTHGKGKLQIDVDKHTFVFNGQDFEPSVQVGLRARTAGSDDYVIFATGKATPSGNLHIAGMWEAGVAPEDVLAGAWYYPVYGFVLENNGWFVAKIACYYSTDEGFTWKESANVGGISIWTSKSVFLGDLGVPYDALVRIHAIVEGGKDRTGSEVYRHFYTGCFEGQHWVEYMISGTTWNPVLEWAGVYPEWN